MTCRKNVCLGKGLPRILPRQILGCCRSCPPLEPSWLVFGDFEGYIKAYFTCSFSFLAQLSDVRSLSRASRMSQLVYEEGADKRRLRKQMLLSAYQAWLCYPQKSLGFGISMGWRDSRDLGCPFSAQTSGNGLWAATMLFPQGRVRKPENDKGIPTLYTQTDEVQVKKLKPKQHGTFH